ncbi:MAG: DUF5719 family protein [Vicinamibacteraceae bacterium]
MRIARVLALCLLPSLAAAQPVQSVQVVHQFTPSPAGPDGALVQVPDGSFYGVTAAAIYRLASDGTVSTAALFTDGVDASGALLRQPDGALYGTTQGGGADGQGTVFRFDPATGDVRTLHAFTGVREGTSPFDGLTSVGGLLYGVTTTTLFSVDPATGATVMLHTFGEDAPVGAYPASGLTVGIDGLLYGASRSQRFPGTGTGGVYRFDPATGVMTLVHEFAGGAPPAARLLLSPDGRLIGVANVGIYRYDPVADTLDVLAGPSGLWGLSGPLVATPDGSLYGITTTGDGGPSASAAVFRLRPTGGPYAVDVLHFFDFLTTGASTRAPLTRGADGLLYGYAQRGGPVDAGTVFRFDPAAGGPQPNPTLLTVLHQFVPTTIWEPSEPISGSGGRLFGAASAGGSGRRGGIYSLDPATGGFIHAADVPGTAGWSSNSNSPLTLGPDAALYGTTDSSNGFALESGVVRFVPATNATTNTVTAVVPGAGTTSSPIAKAADGNLYFVRGRTVYRVGTDGVATPAGTEPFPPGITDLHVKNTVWNGVVAGGDGQVYVGFVTVGGGAAPFEVFRFSRLFRVNATTNTIDQMVDWSTDAISSMATAPGGVYVATSGGISRFEAATGARTTVCTPGRPAASITPIGDALVGLLADDSFGGEQRLFVCRPATGLTELRTLPASIGRLRGRLVAIGDVLYGATSGDVRARAFGARQTPATAPGGAIIRLSVSNPLPPFDPEHDGLPSDWETTYGLDPFSASGADGAGGDPDGDGRTNAQELVDGTHPRGVLTRYFAEGATGPFFRTRLDLANPNGGRAASVLVRFLTDTGARIAHNVVIPPMGHESIDPATITGLAHATFSSVIEADLPVAVERTMSWDPSGYGSHVETGVVAPSTTWYLAEGSTSGAFALFYLLQNPQETAVIATVRYLRPFGLPPIEKQYSLPPFSRTTIVVDDEGGELTSTDVSAVITAPSPIVAERAMYYSQPSQPFAAGHESAGVTAPALEWFLAEGATGTFFDLFVLIANPNPAPATVEIEYLLAGGGSLTKTYSVAGNSRSTIWVDDEQLPAGSGTRPFAATSLSMVVRSTNAVPIVVERTMWWPGPELTANYWYEAHNSPGATSRATRWVVAGAEVGGADAAQTYVLLANPGSTAAQVYVSVLGDSGLVALWDARTLPPKSRTNLLLPTTQYNQTIASFLIESAGTSPVPIVVERATYASPGGVTWASGGNALASPLP